MGIRQKFFMLVGVVGVILVIVSGVGYYNAYTHLSNSIESEIGAVVAQEGGVMDTWLQKKGAGAANAARLLHNIDPSIGRTQAPLSVVDGDKYVLDLSNGMEDGLFMSWIDGDVSKDADPRTRSWYKDARSAGKLIYTEVYKSVGGTTDGKLVVSAAAPYNDKNGQFRGAVCEDIALDVLNERIDKIKYHGQGEGIIFDQTGQLIASAGQDELLSKLADHPILKAHQEAIQSNPSGFFTVQKDGKNQIFAYTTLQSAGWIIGIFVPEEFVFAEMNTMKITYGILVIIGILLTGFAGITFSNRITASVLQVKEHADELASGNLRLDDIQVDSQDEIGALGNAFNTMSHNIRELIRKMATTAEQVAASSEELTASAQQSADASNHVAGNVSEVSVGMDEQMKSIDEAKKTVDTVFTDITEVAEKMQQITETSGRTADAAQQGESLMNGAMDKMGHIEKSVLASADVVKKLGDNSQQIGQIVDTIAAIAEQTNLLALNAAIEAARAGEHGKGFAVVAEEVRKLAAESQSSAEEIRNRIQAIQGDTEQAVVSMQGGTTEVQHGTAAIREVGEQFKDILRMVNEIKTQIDDMDSRVRAVSDGAGSIVKSVDSIDEVSRKTAENTQSISAATQEQSASTEEIASASQALAQMATELQEATGKFRV